MRKPLPLRKLARVVRGTPPARPPWVLTHPAPNIVRPLDDFAMFAALSTWMEADIVEAAVANAFAQGCERVYLVDNGSPDDTVKRAVDAGATLWTVFHTEAYDEARKMAIMHDMVRTVSRDLGRPVWWMWLDADEFHHGPHGLTTREYLATLDRRFRIVGSRYLNHFPTRASRHLRGEHPLDEQPLAEELSWHNCGQLHRKHTLQLHLPGHPEIVCGPGFHTAQSDEHPLCEPETPLFLHHFPFRDETVARRRLALLCGERAEGARAIEGDIATIHMRNRFRTLDAVYDERWEDCENFWPDRPSHGVTLTPWTDIVALEHQHYARWYDYDDQRVDVASARS